MRKEPVAAILIHIVIKIKCILTLNQHYTEHANRIKCAIQVISKWSGHFQHWTLLLITIAFATFEGSRLPHEYFLWLQSPPGNYRLIRSRPLVHYL